MHKFGKIDFDNLNWEKSYGKMRAYGRSKLANLLFVYELQRRLENIGSNTISLASHPGWTKTELQRHASFLRFFNVFLAQKPEKGALPMLHAATAPEAKGGSYYGPDGLIGLRGYPIEIKSNKKSHNKEDAKKLWDISENLTGIVFKF